MPAIETTPPPEGSYQFVLRRYDKACLHKIAAYTYDEPTESRAIELDGITAHTLFLSTPPARDYWTKLGWKDETARWEAWLARTRPPPAPAGDDTAEKPEDSDEPHGAASSGEQGGEEAAGTPPLRSAPVEPPPPTRPPYPGPSAESIADPEARLVARARELLWNAGKTLTIGQLIAKLGEPEATVRAVLQAAATRGELTARGAGSIVVYGLPTGDEDTTGAPA